jgi:general secretion pathway protein A
MYNQFFHLREAPFQMRADPRFLFLAPQHREALAGITNAVLTGKRLVVLTGDVGTGKTTLLNTALQCLPAARAQCCALLNPILTPAELLGAILLGFGETSLSGDKAERLARLEAIIAEAGHLGRTPVVLIDEAHLLSTELLEEIRLLGNFTELQIILCGQPELNAVLKAEGCKVVKQRVAWRLVLDPLSPEQVTGYIRYRWSRAGAEEPPPFSREALEAVWRWSEGVPRLVNSICDNALTLAFKQKTTVVGAGHVTAAARMLQIVFDPKVSNAGA